MAIVIELVDSQKVHRTIDGQDEIELSLGIVGGEIRLEIEFFVQANLPGFVDGLPFQDYECEHLGGGNWTAKARYKANALQKNTGDFSYEFEIGGGTQKIQQSLATIAAYTVSGTATDYEGAINVSSQGGELRVEGVDVPISQYNWTETHYLPNALLNDAYKALLFLFSHRTMNDSPWRVFQRGEVLFKGAKGKQRTNENAEISFSFSALQTLRNFYVGTGANKIKVIEKLGWDYLWVKYQDELDVDNTTMIKRPKAVYIERVMYERNFNLLGIGP